MNRFKGYGACATGGNPPTADALLVRQAGVRVPYRAVALVEVDAEYGWETAILTCGHTGSGKRRKNGTYPCYDCQVENAKKALSR